VAGEGVAGGAGDRIPDPHLAAIAGGGQPGPIRGGRQRPHPVGVAGEGVAGGSALAESMITVITGAWATVADGSTTGARWSRPGHDRCAAP
jgi:hypothetical protein